MYTKTIKQIMSIKDELSDIIEFKTEKLFDSTDSNELQNDLQRNVIDYISDTIEQIDIILENIESGEYDNEPYEDFNDY